MNPIKSLLLLSIVGVAMTSCVVTDSRERPVATAVSASFGTYDALPDTYVGDAYYYQNRYYYGGNYERGVFHDHGRQYSDRYNYRGQYYYGGRYDHHASRSQQQSKKQDSRGDHRDHDRR